MLRFLFRPILKRLEALEENERLKVNAVDQKYHWVRKSAQVHNIAIDDILKRLEALEENKRLVEDKLRKHVKVCVMLISDSIADNIYLVNKRLNALEDKAVNGAAEDRGSE